MPFVPDKPTPGFVPDQVSQNPQQIPDAADKAAQGNKPQAQAISTSPDSPLMTFFKKGLGTMEAAKAGLVKGATFGNFDPKSLPGFGNMYKQVEQEHPFASGMGQLAGGIASGSLMGAGAAAISPEVASSAPVLQRLGAAFGRIGINTGTSALQGFLTKPEEGGSRGKQAAVSAMIAGPLSAGAEILGSLGSRSADWIMKQASGIKKDVFAAEDAAINPETGKLETNLRGVGNKLIDMGIRGSKDSMADQVAAKMASEESNLQDLTSQLSDKLSPKDLADAVSQHAKRFTLPSTGKVIPGDESELKMVQDLADKYSSMGELTPADYLAIKRSGGSAGFTKAGAPGAALSSQIGRSVADAAREKLGSLDPDIINTLGNEQALVLASKGLNKPSNVQGNALTSLLFSKTPAVLGSYGATGLQKGSETMQNPILQQGLFGAGNQLINK